MLLNEIEDINGNIIKEDWNKIDEKWYSFYNNKFHKNYLYKKCKCTFDGCNNIILQYKSDLLRYLPFCSNCCRGRYQSKDNNPLDKNIQEIYDLYGIIATDGNVSKDNENRKCNEIKIALNEIDKQYLDIIQSLFGGSLFYRKQDNQWKWLIISYDFKQHLISIGITPNKSLTLDVDKWFNTLDYNQKLRFWNNAFYGDGCICNTTSNCGKNKITKIKFCSASLSFITTLFNFIKNDILKDRYGIDCKNNIIIEKSRKENCHDIYRFDFASKSSVYAICNEIVNTPSKLFMERKFDKCVKFIEEYELTQQKIRRYNK